jgi:hypothetical protein
MRKSPQVAVTENGVYGEGSETKIASLSVLYVEAEHHDEMEKQPLNVNCLVSVSVGKGINFQV